MARSHRDLRVYQNAFAAAAWIFERTRAFPPDQRYALIDQSRRTSRSVCASIAEAWRRRRYPAAFVARLVDAQAEADETRVHFEFAHACGYLTDAEARQVDLRYDSILAQLSRMMARPYTGAPRAQRGRVSPPSGSAENDGSRCRDGGARHRRSGSADDGGGGAGEAGSARQPRPPAP